MKNKIFIIFASILMAGLMAMPVLPIGLQITVLVVAGVAAVFMHKENILFCKKLDRVLAGEKNVKF